ncbi:MAG: hypothetical protein ACE5OZ_08910 [Candidatus Heimdallarchaeota archaeon]
MILDEYKEGMARFYVPRLENNLQKAKICPTKADPVFFNPLAKHSRDLSVLFLHSLSGCLERQLSVCELLTGTGVRGIRYLLEAPVNNILLNDKNPQAAELAKKNLTLNQATRRATVVNEDAFSLIQTKIGNEWFDFVDIDPFGSPQRYYMAGLLVNRSGAIALSATDIPALIGIYPKTALRRYRITHSFRSEFEKETATRALLASFQLRMLSFGRAFVPFLSVCLNHYIRVFLCRSRNRSEIAEKIGFIGYCAICDERWILPVGSKYHEIAVDHPHPIQLGGPLWLGRLHCPQTAEKMRKHVAAAPWKDEALEKLLSTIAAEAKEFPPWFYDSHKQAKRRKAAPESIDKITTRLREKGYLAERTHMSLTGIKTNARNPEIVL